MFRDLADVFDGRAPKNPPNLGEVLDVMLRHARALSDWFGEAPAMRAFRRHTTWYTKGFRGSATMRQSFMKVRSIDDLLQLSTALDPTLPFPPEAMRVPRGKSSGTQQVSLPAGYLDHRDDATPPEEDDAAAMSGG